MSPLHDSFSPSLWKGLRPLLEQARDADIAVAYATRQGAILLVNALEKALLEGAAVRLLVGCYLGGTRPDALRELLRLSGPNVEVKFIADPHQHFHPKVYRIITNLHHEYLFVGSSNLSRDALCGGDHVHEWTLELSRPKESPECREIDQARRSFERLFKSHGEPLTEAVIARFEQLSFPTLPPAAMLDAEELPVTGATPNEAQEQALEALRLAREQGHRRALVVAATGLGKTRLAAHDSLQVVAPGKGRILVVAHRRELLKQAADAFQMVRGTGESQGFLDQDRKETTCDQVFASVWSLDRLSDEELRAFDYVIVDEAHHGTAASYRRVFEVATPRFLLGLTATPERLDQADVYALFHGVVACEVNLQDGIAKGWLVPFRYEGVLDPVDYGKLSWMGGNLGYSVKELNSALISDARTQKVLEVMGDARTDAHRTLLFCVSIAHAEHTAAALTQDGWRVRTVHSGPSSIDPREGIKDLERGDLQALVTVDMFNEGVDIPSLDRVLLLRPTDSPTVFLQQIGRGLRKFPGKEYLTVIDLVGNHRRANQRLGLLGLGLGEVLAAPAGQALRVKLPGGSEIVLDVQVLDALKAVEQALMGPRRRLLTTLEQMAQGQAERPRLAAFLTQSGMTLSTVRALFSSWLGLLEQANLLSPADRELLGSDRAKEILNDVEETPMTGPHKMLLLGAMARAERTEVTFAEARDFARPYAQALGPDVWTPAIEKAFPKVYPVEILVSAHPSWCHAQGETFSLGLPHALTPSMMEAIAERAEGRLREWLWNKNSPGLIKAEVIKQGQGLCLMLGKAARKLGEPGTWVGLRFGSEVWFGKVVKVAINVIQRDLAATESNQATNALLSLTGAASVEQAQGRQLRLAPCEAAEPTTVPWFEVQEW